MKKVCISVLCMASLLSGTINAQETMKENIGATDIRLSAEEVRAIDAELDTIEMSDVFGGSPIIEKPKTEGE